jgi:hypothetical protein
MLREFSALWIVFFGGVALWQWFGRDHQTLALIYGGLAITLGPIGVVAPAVMRPIFIAWLAAAFPIGWVVSRVLLLILFFGVITPVAIIFRMIGRDVLSVRRGSTDTYWTSKPQPGGPASYFRQF